MFVLIYMLLTWKFQDMRAKNAPDSRQYDTSKSAVFVSFLCSNPNMRVLGESLIH